MFKSKSVKSRRLETMQTETRLMLTQLRKLTIGSLSAATLALALGCGGDKGRPASDNEAAKQQPSEGPDAAHDPHDIPLTEEEIAQLKQETASYPAAVQRIQQFRDTIRQETTGGTPATAHRALDNLDHVLGWLPEIAQNSNVPRAQWQTVGEDSQKLQDLFNQVHANIDEGRDPDYPAVADEIDAAVERLAAIKAGAARGRQQ
jgi:hypothetical protein